MKLSELLDKPEKWTKGAFARDSKGVPSWSPLGQEAVCWCLSGAIRKLEREGHLVFGVARRKITEHIKFPFISGWNDAPERTFEDIQKVLKELDL